MSGDDAKIDYTSLRRQLDEAHSLLEGTQAVSAQKRREVLGARARALAESRHEERQEVLSVLAFRVGGETREWHEGKAFVFDDTIEHEAWNNSQQDRAVLILDCWNPHLSEAEQAIILKIFAISEGQRPDKPVRG